MDVSIQLTLFGRTALAAALGFAIGLEREYRGKSAGDRTFALLALGAAAIVATGAELLVPDATSRVIQGVVTGVGFIGGGLIFVRRDAVRGLTTAATIWLTAGVGMAAGAGLPILACLVTGAHFVVVYGFTPLVKRLESLSGAVRQSALRITYRDRAGILREVLTLCTGQGYVVAELTTEQVPDHEQALGAVSVTMRISGPGSVPDLVAVLAEVPGVLGIRVQDPDEGE